MKQISAKNNKEQSSKTEQKIPYKKWNIKTGWVVVGFLDKDEKK
jgi:hypothetical protein